VVVAARGYLKNPVNPAILGKSCKSCNFGKSCKSWNFGKSCKFCNSGKFCSIKKVKKKAGD